jgi:hypothetical protein
VKLLEDLRVALRFSKILTEDNDISLKNFHTHGLRASLDILKKVINLKGYNLSNLARFVLI